MDTEKQVEKHGEHAEGSAESEKFNFRYSLQNHWTVWFDNSKGKAKEWLDNLKKVVTIRYVEEFWGFFNNTLQPSNMLTGSTYYMFLENVVPAWEDKANRDGGKWQFVMKKGANKKDIDTMFLNVSLAVIGEAFPADEVTGLVIAVRTAGNRVAIWTRHSDEATVRKVGECLKAQLELDERSQLAFSKHSDANNTLMTL